MEALLENNSNLYWVNKDFVLLKKEDRTIIGVDFGTRDDMSVMAEWKFEKGNRTLISSSIIGRSKDFDNKEKRLNYLNSFVQSIKEENFRV